MLHIAKLAVGIRDITHLRVHARLDNHRLATPLLNGAAEVHHVGCVALLLGLAAGAARTAGADAVPPGMPGVDARELVRRVVKSQRKATSTL